MKKVLAILISAAVIMAVFTGCSKNESSADRIKMRVAYMPNMGSASTLITAVQKGYFDEQGIDVELVKFAKGPEEIAAMGSGNIDVSQIGHGAHALCAKGQARIFTIDCTSLADEVLANKDKGINTIKDLKGKQSLLLLVHPVKLY